MGRVVAFASLRLCAFALKVFRPNAACRLSHFPACVWVLCGLQPFRMLAKSSSFAVFGVDAFAVEVEVHISSGKDVFNTVGPNAPVSRARYSEGLYCVRPRR